MRSDNLVSSRRSRPTDANQQDIRFTIEEGVATITLQRPEQMNAFTGRMGRELGRAYRECDADDAIRAVVLTGAGGAFCAGVVWFGLFQIVHMYASNTDKLAANGKLVPARQLGENARVAAFDG